MTHPFRFGVQLRKPAAEQSWLETVRKAEDLGYGSVLMPDHFSDEYAPSVALAAAAAVTESIVVGALVYGNDYRHPAVLAKEMATLDQISGGRVEFGLGAGWMRTDYEQLGIPYDRPGVRIERMVEAVAVIRGCFGAGAFDYAGEHYTITGYDGHPKPVRAGGPPLMIGGGGPRMLGVAARHADIVGVTATLRAGEVGPEAIADSMAEAYDRKLDRIREVAGDRFDSLELNSLSQAVIVTDDRQSAIEGIAELFAAPAEHVADSPAVLIGSVAEIVDMVQARRDRWGFNYVTVSEDALDAFAPVVAELNGR